MKIAKMCFSPDDRLIILKMWPCRHTAMPTAVMEYCTCVHGESPHRVEGNWAQGAHANAASVAGKEHTLTNNIWPTSRHAQL